MREHWQPTIFERWEQGSKARALIAAQARTILSTEEPSLLSLPASRHDLLTRLPRPLRVVCVALGTATGLAAAACGPTPAPKPSEVRQPGSSPVLATKVETPPSARTLPLDGEVYFTQGAHSSDGSPTGVKSGIDLAPKRVVNCVLGALPIEEQSALATASGKITIVGNERDANDPNHSIVEIQESGTGLRFGVMHLSELPDHVRVGSEVSAGTPIGKPSCEVPKGGKTTGVHAHQYVKNQKGNYLPINGLTFSGWTIQGDIMTKGSEKRMADQRRCATDQACGGIRNDLGVFWRSSKSGLVESVKVAPLPTVTPTPKEKPVQPGFDRYPSTVNPYQIDYLRDYRVHADNKAKFDIFRPPDLWSTTPSASIMIITEPINSWVNLEAYRIKVLNQFPHDAQNPPTFVPKLVDGRDGWSFEYINPRSSIPYIRSVIFIYKDLGWKVTLSAARADSATIEKDRQLFNQMVSSMKLR